MLLRITVSLFIVDRIHAGGGTQPCLRGPWGRVWLSAAARLRGIVPPVSLAECLHREHIRAIAAAIVDETSTWKWLQDVVVAAGVGRRPREGGRVVLVGHPRLPRVGAVLDADLSRHRSALAATQRVAFLQ